jgi:hypothetical protein
VLVVLAQQHVQPLEGEFQGLRERATARIGMGLLDDELDDVVYHEQGRFMTAMPVHDDRAEHGISANVEALDAQAVFSLETQRVRGKNAGHEHARPLCGLF